MHLAARETLTLSSYKDHGHVRCWGHAMGGYVGHAGNQRADPDVKSHSVTIWIIDLGQLSSLFRGLIFFHLQNTGVVPDRSQDPF